MSDTVRPRMHPTTPARMSWPPIRCMVGVFSATASCCSTTRANYCRMAAAWIRAVCRLCRAALRDGRLSHDQQRAFLTALDTTMISSGLASTGEAIFDLDFHAVMHWGEDPALEKHYVPTRSQRTRSVLTFFAQDSGTHNLLYANADLSKATQNREVIVFCDHWKTVSGHDPHLLILDSNLTTQPVLGELDARGVKFLTLRPRSPSLAKQISAIPATAFTPVALDRSGKHTTPKVHQMTGVKLTKYPGTVRQLVVTGLGHATPTIVITNDHDKPVKTLIEHYARRMTIEQRLAEIIRAFCLDALTGLSWSLV